MIALLRKGVFLRQILRCNPEFLLSFELTTRGPTYVNVCRWFWAAVDLDDPKVSCVECNFCGVGVERYLHRSRRGAIFVPFARRLHCLLP